MAFAKTLLAQNRMFNDVGWASAELLTYYWHLAACLTYSYCSNCNHKIWDVKWVRPVEMYANLQHQVSSHCRQVSSWHKQASRVPMFATRWYCVAEQPHDFIADYLVADW